MAEEESKKRKRKSNGVDVPKKKVAIDGVASSKITVTFRDGNATHPVLVSSPGLTAPSLSFKAYSKPRRTRSANDAPKPATHDLLLQSSKHPRLDYIASPAALDEHLLHYVALFDPATNSLQVTPAHHVSLRSTLRAEAQEVEQDKPQATYVQQRELLGKEFGTKKTKKAIASKIENAISKDNKIEGKTSHVQSAILETVAESAAATPKKKEQAETLLASKPIPKPNLQAEHVEDVYPLNTLIPPGDMRLIPVKDWQDKIRASEEIMFSHRYPAFRISRLGGDDDVLKLKALRYLTCLLDFNAALQNAGRSGKKVPKKEVLSQKLSAYPEPLVDSIRRRFSTSNELPKWYQDNLCTHMCALTLYIDSYVTDISNMKDDLRLEMKQMQQYFSELGCKVARPTEKDREARGLSKAQAASTRVARLRVPLEFPKLRLGRGR